MDAMERHLHGLGQPVAGSAAQALRQYGNAIVEGQSRENIQHLRDELLNPNTGWVTTDKSIQRATAAVEREAMAIRFRQEQAGTGRSRIAPPMPPGATQTFTWLDATQAGGYAVPQPTYSRVGPEIRVEPGTGRRYVQGPLGPVWIDAQERYAPKGETQGEFIPDYIRYMVQIQQYLQSQPRYVVSPPSEPFVQTILSPFAMRDWYGGTVTSLPAETTQGVWELAPQEQLLPRIFELPSVA